MTVKKYSTICPKITCFPSGGRAASSATRWSGGGWSGGHSVGSREPVWRRGYAVIGWRADRVARGTSKVDRYATGWQ